MAHVELPKEELEPILEAIKEAFEPLTKAMPLIAKIPQEIKRISDNIAKDLESGVPQRTANAVEKIADNPELVGPPNPEIAGPPKPDNLVDPMEKLNAQLQLLLDNGIPAKIDEDNKIVKLTEKEIKETQKTFIENKKEQELIKEQIETVKKSDMTAEEMADKLQVLTENLQKNTQETQELETTLGDKTPQQVQPGQSDESGFVAPTFVSEPFEVGRETLMAGPNAIMQLKDSFTDNISKPLKSLLKANKKHHDTMEDYAENDKENSIAEKAKTLLMVGGIVALAKMFTSFLDEDEETETVSTFDKNQQAAYNEARDSGDVPEVAEVKAEQDATKKFRGGFLDIPGILGMRDEETDIMNPDVYSKRIDDAKRRNAEKNLREGNIGKLFLEQQSKNAPITINKIDTNNIDNSQRGAGGGSKGRPDTPKLSGAGYTIA